MKSNYFEIRLLPGKLTELSARGGLGVISKCLCCAKHFCSCWHSWNGA